MSIVKYIRLVFYSSFTDQMQIQQISYKQYHFTACFSLLENCPYSELVWSAFSRIWTEYGQIWSISPYSIRMWENADQNNSEYGYFLRSACHVMYAFRVNPQLPECQETPYSKQARHLNFKSLIIIFCLGLKFFWKKN